MLTETGRSLQVPEEHFVGIDLITAILAHPIRRAAHRIPPVDGEQANQRGRSSLRFGLARRRLGLLPAGNDSLTAVSI